MKVLKVTREEVEALLIAKYNLKEIKYMKNNCYEGDLEISENYEFIEGELQEK